MGDVGQELGRIGSLEGKLVNKTQLIDALAARYEGNRKAAAHALESVLDTITREVARGEKVAITGFGSFEKKIREARTVRNPRTGEKMRAKKKAIPKFTPGADLKAVISGAKKLPKLTLAKRRRRPRRPPGQRVPPPSRWPRRLRPSCREEGAGEEGSGQGCCQEGARQDHGDQVRGQEGAGEEGSRHGCCEEGSGQEGSGQEGSGQEG